MTLRLAVAALFAALPTIAFATPSVFPAATWQQKTPFEVGLDVAKLDQLPPLVLGSGMIVRHGYQVYAWGDETQKFDWGSASKPLKSTWLFLADDEGLCTIQSAVGDFRSGGSVKDSSITFFQLANMTSGYSRAESGGQAWAYNDHAINLYGYVLCYQVFGLSPQGVFNSRMGFLQAEDGVSINGTFQYGRVKSMSIRDFARLGLFWLNRGTWDGTEYLPAAYFDTYVTNQVPAGLPRTTADGTESWNLGSHGGTDDQTRNLQGHYGMNFYVNTNQWWPGLPANIYQANGHDGGEVCTIIPDLDIVAVGAGGTWGNPSRQAIQILYDALLTIPVEDTSWGEIKAGYRE